MCSNWASRSACWRPSWPCGWLGGCSRSGLVQQRAHRVRADRVPLRPQGGGELLVALGHPQQRPHRVAQRDRPEELAQVLQQGGIADAQRVPTAAVAPHPATGQRGSVEILQPPADGAAGQAGGPHHRRQTAVVEGAHLRRRRQAPPLLIQLVARAPPYRSPMARSSIIRPYIEVPAGPESPSADPTQIRAGYS